VSNKSLQALGGAFESIKIPENDWLSVLAL
jgi:hypothetical protein